MIRKLFFYNFGWKLASVTLATGLWVMVEREPELTTTVSAPIEYKNLPVGLDIGGDTPDRIRLEVRGPSGRLTPASLGTVAVVLDLSKVQGPGERTFNVSEAYAHLPEGVSVYRAAPSQVHVAFEQIATKEVLVKPRYAGPAATGYRILSYEMKPPRVSVTGPSSHLSKIETVETDPIDLSGVVGLVERRVHVYMPDPQVRLSSIAVVECEVVLEKDSNKETKK